jgi:hypothetical protein
LNSAPLVLAAPDFAALDTLARRSQPAVLWPVGSQSLAAHWLDHAVRQGHKRVIIHSPDRPAQVRTELAGGAYWSLDLEISPQPAPAGANVMVSLPDGIVRPVPGNAADLLRWWLALNLEWLDSRKADAVSIDRRQADGGWVGPHARIHPSCKLRAPYWIGARSIIGPGCTIGPGALVGADCLLDHDINVGQSLVLARTSLGAHLDVQGVIINGPLLLDAKSGTRVAIVDRFIADALHRPSSPVAWLDRVAAALLLLPASLAALGRGPVTREQIPLPGGGRPLSLATGRRGLLLGQRAGWLLEVIAGRLRLVGPLPRRAEATADLPAESRALLAEATPGVFSLADSQGIHTTADTEELAHALYQAAVPAADRGVWRQLPKLCVLRPKAGP